jgi:hypothetical protein
MVFVEICAVVVGTTSKTTTTWVLPVLSYTTMTCRDVTPMLAGLGESGRHLFDKPIACVGKTKRLNPVEFDVINYMKILFGRVEEKMRRG